MANINYQRKGIRITVAVFGPGKSGKHSFLESLRRMSKAPAEMMSVREEGGEMFSFFVSAEPRKLDGVELHARFLTARDIEGGGRVWESVLKQADGAIFVADCSPGAEFENLKAQSIFNHLLSQGASEASAFFFNKGDLPRAVGKDRMNTDLNPAGKPSFAGNTLSGQNVAEAALSVARAAFGRFQKPFEEMAGTGSLSARVSLALSGVPTPAPKPAEAAEKPAAARVAPVPEPAKPKPSAPPAPAPSVQPAAAKPAAPEPPAPSTEPPAPKPPSDELTVEIDSSVFEAVAPADLAAADAPPAQVQPAPTGPPESAPPPPPQAAEAPLPSVARTQPHPAAEVPLVTEDEIRDLEAKLVALSTASSAIPELCETITHVSVAVKMLSDRIAGLEAAANACDGAAVNFETFRPALDKLMGLPAAVAALRDENERVRQHLDGEASSRTREAEAHASALAQANEQLAQAASREERLASKLTEAAAEIEKLKASSSALEDRAAGLEKECAAARDELGDAQARERDLSVRLSEALSEGQSGSAKCAEVEARLAESEAAAAKALSDAAEAGKRLADADAEAARASAEAAGLRKGIEGANAELAAHEKTLETERARAQTAEEAARALAAEKESLAAAAAEAARVGELEGELSAGRARSAALEQSLAAARAEVETAVKTEAAEGVLREQVQTLTQMLDRKNRELEMSIQQVTGMEKALEEARAGVKSAADDAAAKLGQELVILQLELQNRDEQVRMLEAQVAATQGEAQALRSQVAELSRQVLAFQAAQAAVQAAQASPASPFVAPAAVHDAHTRPVPVPSQQAAPPAGQPPRSAARPAAPPPAMPPRSQAAQTAPKSAASLAARPPAAPPRSQAVPAAKPIIPPAPAGSTNQDPAHAGAKQMARVLVMTFVKNHEKDLLDTLRSGAYQKAFGPMLNELRKTYDARVPARVAAVADYFSEELNAAIETLKKKLG
ncbi:MAG: hypothetical protein HY897_08015 [Deltaproteobacteria bacterium]|nr:hypothetical protein [Deltaproteobacteria bacterium]